MKNIIIKSLSLINWRGEMNRTTEFHLDAPTYICGDNGLGKSRHFDAFCWLLFGKDSQDRKDFELRTYDKEHNVKHRCECSVSAELIVDGEIISIKRASAEKWQKPKGQVEDIFKGNVTECYWNGTPVSVTEYQKRVAGEIIDDTLFKMITNPRFFTETMKWQDQRETLLQMAGTLTDVEIAQGDEDYKLLLDRLSGKSLTDYRKTIASEKKRLMQNLAEIQPRIDQTQKMMPEDKDWDSLEAERARAEAEIKAIDEQLQSAMDDKKAIADKVVALEMKLADGRSKKFKIAEEAKRKLQEEVDGKNAKRHEIEMKLRDENAKLSQHNIDLQRAKQRQEFLQGEADKVDAQLQGMRKEWMALRDSRYEGSNICPCCGQPLPKDKVGSAIMAFEHDKYQKLENNTAKGKAIAAQAKSIAEEMAEKAREMEAIEANIVASERTIKVLNETLDGLPLEKMPDDIDKEAIPEYAALSKELDALSEEKDNLNAQLHDPQSSARKAELNEQKRAKQQEMNAITETLHERVIIEKARKEIEALGAKGKEIAQKIADIEYEEYVAASFSKKKIEECEKRINQMFKMVKFQLFDYTQEGNEFEVCIPLVDGTPYPVANTASQVNAGLDIINTLCRFNNVSAPIFVDGAESVNSFLPVESQMILLQVTKDKELTVK